MQPAIIVVHGRRTKPSRTCKVRYVREVLIESARRVDRAVGRWLARHPQTIQVAYYADLLRRLSGERADGCASYHESLNRLYRESRACPTWLAFQGRLNSLGVNASVQLAQFLDPSLRAQFIARRFADVLRYLTDRTFATQVRARLECLLVPALHDQCVMLIGHSLGSIIAYDTLWTLSHGRTDASIRHQDVHLFVTLGSPLGDGFIKQHLLGAQEPADIRYPTNIREWHNLSALGDAISYQERLAADVAPMFAAGHLKHFEDHVDLCAVYRGRAGQWNPHKLYGYLLLPEMGRLVVEHVRGVGQDSVSF